MINIETDMFSLHLGNAQVARDETQGGKDNSKEDDIPNVPKDTLMEMLATDLSQKEKHEIRLKEGARPVALKLRRLGFIKRHVLEL